MFTLDLSNVSNPEIKELYGTTTRIPIVPSVGLVDWDVVENDMSMLFVRDLRERAKVSYIFKYGENGFNRDKETLESMPLGFNEAGLPRGAVIINNLTKAQIFPRKMV